MASRQFALDTLCETTAFAALSETERAAKLKSLSKLKKAPFAEAISKAVANSAWLPECLITPMRRGAFVLGDTAAPASAAQA